MSKIVNARHQLWRSYQQTFLFFAKYVLLGTLIGLLVGSICAGFLVSLEKVTAWRLAQPWLLFLLPLGGVIVGYVYHVYGGNSIKGNNLILESIQDGKEVVPVRMSFLIWFATLVTHLLGGSAGREGTAVQMGGSIAEGVGKVFKISQSERRILLMCGISSGFGAVFGTPLAGTVFALEIAMIGIVTYQALLPCLVASLTGHFTVIYLWGVQHTHYSMGEIPTMSAFLLMKVVIASIAFGFVGMIFSTLIHTMKKLFQRYFHHYAWRSIIGGCAVILLVYVLGTRSYLGLGLPLLTDAFETDIDSLAFMWKTLFTVVTLGSGFQGGEVTPLFIVGATLGHSLSLLLQISTPFLAGLGFVAVFGAAANTPLACIFMGIELFGGEGAIYIFIACVISYLFSGHQGIYSAQKVGYYKHGLKEIIRGRDHS